MLKTIILTQSYKRKRKKKEKKEKRKENNKDRSIEGMRGDRVSEDR